MNTTQLTSPLATTAKVIQWRTAQARLQQATDHGTTGAALEPFLTAATTAWYAAAELAIRDEIPGAVLKDFTDESWEWLRAGGLTPVEAAAWQATDDSEA